MKLIQLNIWDGILEHPLLRFLEEQQPDVLCLQELKYTKEMPFILEAIKEKTGLEHHFVSPLLGYEHAGIHFDWSNCLISRYPLIDAKAVYVHKDYNPAWKMGEDFNFRNFQHAQIHVDGTLYHLVNYHGYHVSGTKLGNETTITIMNNIHDHIKTLSGRVILAGDFNLTPDSPSLAGLNHDMRNLCAEYDIPTTRNYIAKRPQEVIDYIYVSKDIAVKNFHVPSDVVSDHQALILEL